MQHQLVKEQLIKECRELIMSIVKAKKQHVVLEKQNQQFNQFNQQLINSVDNLDEDWHLDKQMASVWLPSVVIKKEDIVNLNDFISQEEENRPNNEPTSFKCHHPGCNKTFTLKSSRNNHQRFVHSSGQPYLCSSPDCGKRFKMPQSLKAHQEKHDNSLLKCNRCSRRFTRKLLLTRHMKSRHSNDHSNFKCSICSKKLSSASKLEIHERQHTGERPYKCKSCRKSFTSKGDLNRHKIIHDKPKQWRCTKPGCDKAFDYKKVLKNHLLHHCFVSQYKCPKCSKEFNNKRLLAGHLMKHRRGD